MAADSVSWYRSRGGWLAAARSCPPLLRCHRTRLAGLRPGIGPSYGDSCRSRRCHRQHRLYRRSPRRPMALAKRREWNLRRCQQRKLESSDGRRGNAGDRGDCTPTRKHNRKPEQPILVGTGEANASGDSYYGLGFLRSTDRGNTWTLVSSADGGTHPFQGLAVSKIVFSTAQRNTVVAG